MTNFLYYMLQCELLCVPTSGSGFYQWVSILPVGLDMKTPCATTHNHGIITNILSHYYSNPFFTSHHTQLYLPVVANSALDHYTIYWSASNHLTNNLIYLQQGTCMKSTVIIISICFHAEIL